MHQRSVRCGVSCADSCGARQWDLRAGAAGVINSGVQGQEVWEFPCEVT